MAKRAPSEILFEAATAGVTPGTKGASSGFDMLDGTPVPEDRSVRRFDGDDWKTSVLGSSPFGGVVSGSSGLSPGSYNPDTGMPGQAGLTAGIASAKNFYGNALDNHITNLMAADWQGNIGPSLNRPAANVTDWVNELGYKDKLKEIRNRHGLGETLFHDDGTAFTADETEAYNISELDTLDSQYGMDRNEFDALVATLKEEEENKKGVVDKVIDSFTNVDWGGTSADAAAVNLDAQNAVGESIIENLTPEQEAALRTYTDLTLNFGRSALTGTRLVSDAFGASNPVSDVLQAGWRSFYDGSWNDAH